MGKDKKTTQTNSVRADPTTLAREQQMWNQASQLASQPYQAYSGQRVAGFNADQNAGFQAVRDAQTAGQGAMNQGIDYATQAGAYNPNDINAWQAGPAALANDPGSILNAYSAVGSSLGGAGARDVSARSAASMGLDQYLNPHTNNVVDATLSDLDLQRQRAITGGQSSATQAGAFGGSRHGVADSLTNEAALRQAALSAGQLRSDGFNTALGMAQGDANRDMQAQLGNQQADVSTSIANANNQWSFAGQGLNAANQAGMFNAGQQNAMSQFNANLGQAADIQNQNAGLTANSQKLQAGGLLGQQGQAQQGMALSGANSLLQSGAIQQANDQANLDVGYQNWQEKQQDPWNKLLLQQGFQGTAGTDSTQKTTEHGSALGTLGGIVGLGAQVFGGPLGGLAASKLGLGAKAASPVAGTGVGGAAPGGYSPGLQTPWQANPLNGPRY